MNRFKLKRKTYALLCLDLFPPDFEYRLYIRILLCSKGCLISECVFTLAPSSKKCAKFLSKTSSFRRKSSESGFVLLFLWMETLPEIRQPLYMHENASVFYGHALISCLKIRCKPDIYVNLSHFTHNQAEFLLHNIHNEQ